MPQILTPEQLQHAATESGIELAALRAVIAVESSGSGFLSNGWVKILFERHILWKRLLERDISPHRFAHDRPDLCGEKWERKYYEGGAKEWDRVGAVITWAQRNAGDHWESYKKAAYESCSWGIFQMMGFHYTAAGYPDVYAMKHAFEDSELAHLQAIMRWMRGNGLLGKLRDKDWREFARGYNGSGQVTRYAGKLEEEYHRAGG